MGGACSRAFRERSVAVQASLDYEPEQHFAPPLPTCGGGQVPESRRKLERKNSKIAYNYNSLEENFCRKEPMGKTCPRRSFCEQASAVHLNQDYGPQQHFATPLQTFDGGQVPESRRKLERMYSRIADNFNTLEQVTEALAQAGLESSNLILGIDFTKSNEWTGSFHRRSLHHIGDEQNPYEQAISIIGKTLSSFDEDNMVPCFGFGDASTHDREVFSFYSDERFCNGIAEALRRYRELVPHLRPAGPTLFAPIIEMAITIVEESGGQNHVLLIIADGQVDMLHERKTVDAIMKASEYPLSIILVGVGDGPWDGMIEFNDNIPARAFDNFQFVNFTEIMSKNIDQSRKEVELALAALMKLPEQYNAMQELNLLGTRKGDTIHRVPLPPPLHTAASFSTRKRSHLNGFRPSARSSDGDDTDSGLDPSSCASSDHVCPICLNNPKDMAFGCGHQTCCVCGEDLQSCPICRSTILTRIKLY